MSAAARLKDLADVQELIRVRGLDGSLAEEIDASVRNRYLELLADVERAREQDRAAE
jgi:hypothetical protein